MERNLNIYFTSDIHGYFSAMDYASGEAQNTGLAACMSAFDKDGNTLIIDGGDTIQGSPFTYWMYSKPMTESCIPAQIMNLAGYDFVTLGNHDFNYGKEAIEEYLDVSHASCLCANVDGIRGVTKTAIVTLENGLRVGLTGITSHFVNLWERPENMTGIVVTDAFTAAKSALEELKGADVDITVCIYHGGFENDVHTGDILSNTGENQGYQICKELDYDILLTGHQHQALENLCLHGTYTCQTPDKGVKCIHMAVTVGSAGEIAATSKLISGDAPASETTAFLAPFEKENAIFLDTPVGFLDTALTPEDPLTMAKNGSLIANFFNQVQLDASGADISVTSLGNTVKGFDTQITIRDIVSTYVFPNTLKTVWVNRSILKTALERCAEYFAYGADETLCISDSFLSPIVQHFNYDYFSGIEVTMDVTKEIGNRITSIRYNGEELADDIRLKLCMNNYRATGAGGYPIYTECDTVCEQPTEIAQMIMDYVYTNKNITVDQTKWLTVLY